MEDRQAGDLAARLSQAGEKDLLELVTSRLGELTPPQALAALRNPYAGQALTDLLLSRSNLMVSHELRRGVAVHRSTRLAEATRLLYGLFWRDLAQIGADVRVRPEVRRAADRRLVDRLAGLSVGEKAVIARCASARVVLKLRHDPSTRVFAALLENPRLTEGQLLPLVSGETTLPAVLELVAKDRRWGRRYVIRLAICRNPRTPAAISVPVLSALKKTDLAAIAADNRVDATVRRRARLLHHGDI